MSIYTRPTQENRRVVVTGMGCVSPLGTDLQSTWSRLIHGESGIDRITAFDASNLETQIAGEVKCFDPDLYIPKKEQKKMDRFIQFSMASAKMALTDAGFEKVPDPLRAGVIVGVGIGGLPMIEKTHDVFRDRGPSRVTPFFIPAVITNLAAGQISIQHGIKGPNFSVTSACATGAHSIGEAAHYIRRGQADIMLAGGSESTISPLAITGFNAMKALSTRNSAPQQASRPWDRDRDGFVLSEGSAILVLEDFEHAARRGARIYAEVTGYGVSSDAFHMTGPSADGEGAARAMQMALMDAKIDPSLIGYVNAHGTSTPLGDEIETTAIKRVFGDAAKKTLVSSTKSMTGHTLGAAGALESVFAIKALTTGVIPPTINLENPSDDCDLDYVPLRAREKKLKHVLNNSFGFGGTNACLIFSELV